MDEPSREEDRVLHLRVVTVSYGIFVFSFRASKERDGGGEIHRKSGPVLGAHVTLFPGDFQVNVQHV